MWAGGHGLAGVAALDNDAPALRATQVLLLLAVTVAVGGRGAYGGPSQIAVGALLAAAFCSAVVTTRASTLDGAAVGSRWIVRFVRPEVGAVALMVAALGLWAIVRAWFAGAAFEGVGVAAVLAGTLASLTVAHRATPPARAAVLTGLVAIGVLLSLAGWIGVVWRVEPLALASSGVWRAAGTLTYENAMAGLLVPLAVVSLAHVVDPEGVRRRQQMALAAITCVLLTGAGATLSRGGVLALVVGIAVLSVLVGPRRLIRGAWGPVMGSVVAVAGLAPSLVAAGSPMPVVSTAALAGGVALAAWSVWRPSHGRWTRFGVVLVGVGLSGALIAVALIAAPGLRDALRPRTSVASPHRVSQHAAALALIAEHPLQGMGPGRGAVSWSDDEGNTFVARYVHDEYIQVTVELGLIGALLLAGVFAFGARAVWYGRLSVPSATWIGGTAALSALAVHSAVDFLWHIPVVPMVAAILTGAVTRYVSSDLRSDDFMNRRELT